MITLTTLMVGMMLADAIVLFYPSEDPESQTGLYSGPGGDIQYCLETLPASLFVPFVPDLLVY